MLIRFIESFLLFAFLIKQFRNFSDSIFQIKRDDLFWTFPRSVPLDSMSKARKVAWLEESTLPNEEKTKKRLHDCVRIHTYIHTYICMYVCVHTVRYASTHRLISLYLRAGRIQDRFLTIEGLSLSL